MKKTFFSLATLPFLAVLFVGCRENDDELKRQQGKIEDPPTLNDIYQGEPPIKKGCVFCPTPLNKNVRLENGMLVFENEEHFRLVRNCLAQTREDNIWQYENMVSQFVNESHLMMQEEKILKEFESWYPGYASLRMKWRQQEDAWLAAGMPEEQIPEAPPVLDPAEQTLVNADGYVKIGGQVFNIFSHPWLVKDGYCRNHASVFNLYGPFGNTQYILARTSVSAWPWGTTLYVSATGLRHQGSGYQRVRMPMSAGGGGQLSPRDACTPSIPVEIKASGVLNRSCLTRCYTVLGLPVLVGNGSFSGFYQYNQQNLPPLMLLFW